jgi:hypothetical protein
MTPPVPEPRSRPAFRDIRDRLTIAHPLEAAALLLIGHAPAYVEGHPSGRTQFIYDQSVAPALQKVRRATEEILALAERHKQIRRERINHPRLGDTDNAQPQR